MSVRGRQYDPKNDPRLCGNGGGRSKRTGEPCREWVIKGTDRCKYHSGLKVTAARAKGAIKLELNKWGLGDVALDPGEVLLRLVTQSSARCDMYAQLLAEAYEAAEKIRTAYDAGAADVTVDGDGLDAEIAKKDLERIFKTGGIAALVGYTYAATKDGDIYATGEAVRGLAQLEAAERDRCANFATKAVAAGLAERQVRLAEKQGALLASVIKGVLDDLDLTDEQRAQAPSIAARHLRAVTAA